MQTDHISYGARKASVIPNSEVNRTTLSQGYNAAMHAYSVVRIMNTALAALSDNLSALDDPKVRPYRDSVADLERCSEIVAGKLDLVSELLDTVEWWLPEEVSQ